ncbi:alkaline phosphatase [Strongylocentrotus purpuratus]|uniref:Alkaline phosphatase n=1 Tax=Strongylocentrotus purpuratus TaxID=7668 RepID=A0A7M7RFN6_STRPU|nr:alkaline phosphatase [Strongylocentrotus purpuratus]|eukprot:XP_783443.2 PREDICTED: alkaline phosphatase [Strongylocentrotus purpuratus]
METLRYLQIVVCLFSLSLATSQNAEFWNQEAQDSLKEAIRLTERNVNTAKNIVLFLGDGMSIETLTAARILKGQLAGGLGEDAKLAVEDFPHFGLAKTYSTNKQVPDSAATATAYLCGVKTKTGVLGVDDRVERGDCVSSLGGEVKSILEMAQEAGKSVGFVTTTTLTHASPGALYAKVPDRKWQSDMDIPRGERNLGCVDMAQQFVSNNNIQVALGGGRMKFMSRINRDPEYPSMPGSRIDGRNLIQEWINNKPDQDRAHYVWNEADFNKIDPEQTDYLLGLFEYSLMKFDIRRDNDTGGEPSIAEMTDKAIRILSKNPNGFFLFVEGGRIDHGHHFGVANLALTETVAMDKAIDVALGLVDTEETLVMVTSDHAHTFKMAGYSARGNPILGKSDGRSTDLGSYTTVGYMNGPGAIISSLSYRLLGRRPPVTDANTGRPFYLPQAVVPTFLETHGGDDVAIFAIGPMSHLVHGVHEQNYVSHVMQRAACIGYYADNCQPVQAAAGDDDFGTLSDATALRVDAKLGILLVFSVLLALVKIA